MQLFITPYTTKQKTLTITSPEVVEQARKVLRISSGDHFFVQDMQPGKQSQTRLEVQFSAFEKTHQGLSLVGEMVAEEICPSTLDEITMGIAMPNKRERAELIVQKLCEIGIAHITFWPAERSIIKQWNEKKEERLWKIAKEAIEQSRGRFFPEITFVEKIENILEGKKIILFDKSEDGKFGTPNSKFGIGLVGPEGGRGPKDHELFKNYDIQIKDLGATMLRMETAAIVGGRLLKNSEL